MMQFVIAAPRSGSGKTTVTCALLQALVNRGAGPVAFKCGPDYIDPMFHSEIIGAKSRNLDLFFLGRDTARYLLEKNSRGSGLALIEGVMGYYDGIGLSADASAYDLARATGTPAVLVLDEPTAGLDPAGRENLMANIRDYHRNKKRTIILVSHSMDEIARNVDRILVLKSAHVLMSGTPAEVFARAEELLSAGLDVPQVTRIAMRLREQGLAIDPAVYTVETLERELLALRRGETGC